MNTDKEIREYLLDNVLERGVVNIIMNYKYDLDREDAIKLHKENVFQQLKLLEPITQIRFNLVEHINVSYCRFVISKNTPKKHRHSLLNQLYNYFGLAFIYSTN